MYTKLRSQGACLANTRWRWLVLAGLLAMSQQARAQALTPMAAQPLDSLASLQGMVMDSAKGRPIAGATVVVQGKNIGVATDSSGRFSLLLPMGTYELAISSLGFATRTYPISKKDLGYNVTYAQLPLFYLLSGGRKRGIAEVIVRSAGPPAKTNALTKVQVYFATDREAETRKGAITDFGPIRGRKVSYGTALVTIPGIHKKGAMERPGMLREEDQYRDVVLQSNQVLADAAFFAKLSAQVASSAQPAAFVFVHGYNVSFVDAARRTAQMHFDLKFPGVPVFFSWPSQAAVAPYVVDEQNAEWAQDDFKKFLVDFLTRTNAKQVYIIAHSMGNRLVARAMRDVIKESPNLAGKVQELILAAPDIDADVFDRNIAPVLEKSGIHTTLYASSGDKALMASRLAHGRYDRLGLVQERVPYTTRGLETIVASEADAEALGLDFGLGHSYIADVPLVLTDLAGLIVGRKRPDQRPSLTKVTVGGKSYWNLKP
ncbi:alpha/beta hydrolase [Hymenobacter monticola]|uniref:Alpha/beta hydrolase n=1 Tax=Hymenobacter monticola TaxID=1705399 RepID=A0ABY4B0H6_9BACT|nr:alpha/beta hydrolase [Hymenobacter monticola]UOE32637.1 alpha/beta hydrolase [Hymenobacter monticola]